MPIRIASLCGAQQMHAIARRLAGDGDRTPPGEAGLAVGRDRELEHDMRAGRRACAGCGRHVRAAPPRRQGRHRLRYRPRAAARARRPPPRGLGSSSAETTRAMPAAMIGVGARRRLAVMRAGLERHIKRRAARRRARPPQALRSPHADARRAGSSRGRRSTPSLHHHRADRRIGPGAPEPAPAERQRQRHEAFVVGSLAGSRTPRSLARDAPAACRPRPDSSASAVSKSLASRKLR